jgi:hypothetical protein
MDQQIGNSNTTTPHLIVATLLLLQQILPAILRAED